MKTNEAKKVKEINVHASTIYVVATVAFYVFYRLGISQGRKEVLNSGK